MTALCLIIFLLTLLFSIGYSDFNLTRNVGENATFECLAPVNDSVAWSINNTLYSSNWLPDDYYVIYGEEYYTLYIDEVKLFMSGTIFSCYYIDDDLFSPIGQLYVTFDFDGPDNDTMKFLPNKPAFINCNSTLNENQGVHIIWIINGTVFYSTMMPPHFNPKYSGLYINSTQYSMNRTTIQCLLWSPMLFKNQYYYSEIGHLLIMEKTTEFKCEDNYLCQSNLPQIVFYYQKFDRNETHYTIAWTMANCELSFEYYVVRVSGDTILNSSVGTNTSKSFSLMDVNDNYAIYVKAVQNDGSLCAITGHYLQISSQRINKRYIKAGSYYCHQYDGIHVVWPYERNIQSRWPECRCDSYVQQLLACSCVNDTGYNVSLKDNKICWSNINENGTKVTFLVNNVTLLTYDGQRTPGDMIELMIDVLFADPPAPPKINNIYSTLDTIIVFVKDNFNGNADIDKYHTTIINYANGNYTFDYNTTNENKMDGVALIQPHVPAIANTYCRPLTVTVRSENFAGLSPPSDVFNYVEKADSQKCLCLNHSVKIDANSTSEVNKITFDIACENYYVNTNNFKFVLMLDENEKNFECSKHEIISFGALRANTMYNAVIKVRDSSTNEVCVFNVLVQYTSNNNSALYIGASVGATVLIAFVIIAVVAGIAIWQLHKWNTKRNRGGLSSHSS